MPKKNPRPKKITRLEPGQRSGEAQAIESLTIFWGLCIFATLVLIIAVLALRGSLLLMQETLTSPNTLAAFSDVLLFIAVISGSVGGILTPIVQSQRRRRAPKSLQWTAIGIALTPWILAAILMAQR